MKFNIGLIAIALQVAGVLSIAAPDAAAAAECGPLGVMTVADGADPSQVRRCVDHPIGKRRDHVWQSLAPPEYLEERSLADLKGRDIFASKEQECYYDAGLGCSGGYCWRACGNKPGNGKWCWTAAGDGTGNWLTCIGYIQCNPHAACGKGNQCESCGCGC